MKVFLSADIEGTTGICLWSETEHGSARYPYFQEQMTREVAAACRGALAAGATELLVKDAHDSACNVIPRLLPEEVLLFRGWGRDPLGMVAGLDGSFDGVFFTGYHSAASMDTNPLSHTMNTRNSWVRINGEIASELLINSYAAASLGVPVRLVTGDRGLCESILRHDPAIETVAVSEGVGNGSISIHPDRALRLIEAAAERAMQRPASDYRFSLPEHFSVEICFREHQKAKSSSHYPGMRQTSALTVCYEADDYMEVLRMLHWVL